MPRQNLKRKVRKVNDEEGQAQTSGAIASTAIVKTPSETPTRRRKVKGRLSLLPTLATDVLFEIFVYLQPVDVLNIMYSCRGFRTILIAQSSNFIWKAVRLNVDNFPDRPDDLSEFRYAKLAFDPHCHKCGKKTQNGPFWEVRARFCDKCVKLELVQTTQCVDSAIYFCSYENVLGRIEHRVAGRVNKYPPYFCKTHLKRLTTHVGSLRDPKEGAQTWLISEAGRLKNIREHARKCIVWQNEINRRQQELNQQIRKKRRTDIRQRLIDLGMGDSLDEVSADLFNNHRLVKPAVALTDRSWNTIKGPLLQWLHELAAQRLARLVFKMYKLEHPELFSPSVQDFLAIAEVQAVIKTPSADALSEKNFGDMTILMDNWRKNATVRICDILETTQKRNVSRRKDAVQQQDPRLKTLELATTVFGCSVCLKRSRDIERLDYTPAEYMHYPWVMAHPCVQNEQSDSSRAAAKLWDPKCLRHEVEIGHTVVKPIIDACDLPAQTTTSAEMDALDARFICLGCEHGKRKAAKRGDHIAVYTWRSAINHALVCRYKDGGNTWKRLSDRAAAKVKTLTDCNELDSDAEREASKEQWGCPLCRGCDVEPPPKTIIWLQQHSLLKHGYVSPFLKHNYSGSSGSERHYRLARFPPGTFETVVPRSQLDM